MIEVTLPNELEDFYLVKELETDKYRVVEYCPECEMPTLVRAGRCATCTSCGWSACSL